MKTDQESKPIAPGAYWIIGALAFGMLAMTGSFELSLEHHRKAELEKYAKISRDSLVIDSLGSQLGWHENTWNNFTDDSTKTN